MSNPTRSDTLGAQSESHNCQQFDVVEEGKEQPDNHMSRYRSFFGTHPVSRGSFW
jgi:hypothetical protein